VKRTIKLEKVWSIKTTIDLTVSLTLKQPSKTIHVLF